MSSRDPLSASPRGEVITAAHSAATPAMSKKALGWSLAILAFAQLIYSLDINIVFVALPEVGRALGFSEQSLQWVVSAYTIFCGGFLLLGGRAADQLGQKGCSSPRCSCSRWPPCLEGWHGVRWSSSWPERCKVSEPLFFFRRPYPLSTGCMKKDLSATGPSQSGAEREPAD